LLHEDTRLFVIGRGAYW